jgi:hypothetical protein
MTAACKTNSAERKRRTSIKTYIHVNRLRMMANRRDNTDLPVVAVRRGRAGKPKYAHSVQVNGPSTVVYDPEHSLCVGAEVWIEVPANVEVVCNVGKHGDEECGVCEGSS